MRLEGSRDSAPQPGVPVISAPGPPEQAHARSLWLRSSNRFCLGRAADTHPRPALPARSELPARRPLPLSLQPELPGTARGPDGAGRGSARPQVTKLRAPSPPPGQHAPSCLAPSPSHPPNADARAAALRRSPPPARGPGGLEVGSLHRAPCGARWSATQRSRSGGGQRSTDSCRRARCPHGTSKGEAPSWLLDPPEPFPTGASAVASLALSPVYTRAHTQMCTGPYSASRLFLPEALGSTWANCPSPRSLIPAGRSSL